MLCICDLCRSSSFTILKTSQADDPWNLVLAAESSPKTVFVYPYMQNEKSTCANVFYMSDPSLARSVDLGDLSITHQAHLAHHFPILRTYFCLVSFVHIYSSTLLLFTPLKQKAASRQPRPPPPDSSHATPPASFSRAVRPSSQTLHRA